MPPTINWHRWPSSLDRLNNPLNGIDIRHPSWLLQYSHRQSQQFIFRNLIFSNRGRANFYNVHQHTRFFFDWIKPHAFFFFLGFISPISFSYMRMCRSLCNVKIHKFQYFFINLSAYNRLIVHNLQVNCSYAQPWLGISKNSAN